MKKMFYLSYVYDINGYDRLDLEKRDSLKEIDKITSDLSSGKDVVDIYLSDYNISKKGRVCVLFEDVDKKKKQLEEYNKANEEDKDRLKKAFSYVHMIPVLYKNLELLNFASCLPILQNKLHNFEIQRTILFDDVTSKNEKLKRNKKYIFETEEELDYIINLADFNTAVDLFIKRLKKSSEEEKYFYCRALMGVCNLSKKILKTKYGKIVVYDDAKARKKCVLTKTEILEEESKNMDDFYTYHDLDEVIKYSPDEYRPIGSEGRKK